MISTIPIQSMIDDLTVPQLPSMISIIHKTKWMEKQFQNAPF